MWARSDSWRRAREAAFALCTAWLLMQNLILLSLLPWHDPHSLQAIVARTSAALVNVVGPLWVLPVAALIGWGFVASAARASSASSRREPWEVRRG